MGGSSDAKFGWKTVLGGITLLAGALAAFGLGLPQIATKAEVTSLVSTLETQVTLQRAEDEAWRRAMAQRVAQVDLDTARSALESSELRTNQLEAQVYQFRIIREECLAAGRNDCPDLRAIEDQIGILKTRTRGLRKKVDNLEDELLKE